MDVALRQVAAAGIDGQAAVEIEGAAGRDGAALALGAKAEILELQQHGNREAIVELRDVDLGRSETGPGIKAVRHRPGRQGGDVLAHEDWKLDARLRVGQAALGHGPDEDGRLAVVLGSLGSGDEHGAGAVGL